MENWLLVLWEKEVAMVTQQELTLKVYFLLFQHCSSPLLVAHRWPSGLPRSTAPIARSSRTTQDRAERWFPFSFREWRVCCICLVARWTVCHHYSPPSNSCVCINTMAITVCISAMCAFFSYSLKSQKLNKLFSRFFEAWLIFIQKKKNKLRKIGIQWMQLQTGRRVWFADERTGGTAW